MRRAPRWVFAVLAVGFGGGCSADRPIAVDRPAIRAFAEEIDPSRLTPWVEQLAADHRADAKLDCARYPAMERYPSCELSHDAAITLVEETLAELGYAPTILELGEPPEVARNVVAEVRGATTPDEVVLVAAHLDAFYGGADDNGSGVAVMLELARVAAAHRFARTVRFVGFDLEERGAIGSTRYVAGGYAEGVVGAWVLETVGYTDRRPGSQDSPLGLRLGDVGDSLAVAANDDSRHLADVMLAANDALDRLPLRVVVAGGDGAFPLVGALLRSDNGPFWLTGIPAVMLTDTADYRNPNYHLESDTPDTLDPEFLGRVARLVAAAVAANAEVEP